jgi:gluconate 5-dehydrogenase
MNLFSLQGRTALVTGASRGLGRAMAQGLAGAGAHVVLAARDRAKLEETAGLITAAGGSADILSFDLTDEASCVAAIPEVVRRHGRIDILLNNAGQITWSEFTESTSADFHSVVDTNLTADYLLCREAAKPMMAQGRGRIINIGSVLSVMGRAKTASYVSSKHGIIGLTRTVAADLGRSGITCNCIAPGYFLTEINDSLKARPGFVQSVTDSIPAGRWGNPEDMQGAAIFLASDSSSYVNGHVLMVDGGLSQVFAMSIASPAE